MENMLPSRDNGPDGPHRLRKRLDEAMILRATVEQLRKDLRSDDIALPAVGQGAFEELRAQVAAVVAQREQAGAHAFGLLVNRVDLTEAQVRQAMAAEGLHGLAGAMVLRCLQKVLSRMRHAGLA
jgi:hypothetical protein